MQPTVFNKTIQSTDGREITIETGKLARQADGSVVVRCGNTMLLATVVSNPDPIEGADFMPLSVDYQEKFASSGKIPGGFLKREGKLSDHEVLICRLVDRALRPMFPDDYHADTQVMIQLISLDKDVYPDSLAALAASSALAVSDIPFGGPISEVRVIKIGEEYKVNPTHSDIEGAELDLIVAGTEENIIMVEGEAQEVSEDDMLQALQKAHDEIKIHCAVQKELEKEVGKEQKREYSHEESDEVLLQEIKDFAYDKLYHVASEKIADKKLRKEKFSAVQEEFLAGKEEVEDFNTDLAKRYFHKVEKQAVRNFVLDSRERIDGRQLDEIRPIWCEVDYLPSTHGSAIFTRGETQSLSTVTLGSKLDEQMIDGAHHSGSNKFILHYNFPGFSTGEVRPNRGPGRREVGHGNLALRALKPVIPTGDENPYTIRIVSDILESNGSSSMATVCAGTLALMDAGINIKAPVSGIAMGMISDSETGKYAVLSDILGDEDHLGDMDFKVTGTEKGITACQMDIKIDGLSFDILKEALMQANAGRAHILGKIIETLPAPKEEFKANAPRMEKIRIDKDLIGAVIGPGGKVVQEIQKESGATVVIEEETDAGVVTIFSDNKEAMEMAAGRVRAIVAKPEVDTVYDATVKTIAPYGAFVEFMPGKEGLLHISEIKWERLENMEGVMEVGEEIKVKLIGIDKKTGKFKLSRKVLLPRPEKKA